MKLQSFILSLTTGLWAGTNVAFATAIPGDEAELYDAATVSEAEPVPESEDIRRFDQRSQNAGDPVAEMAELERAANDYLDRAEASISTQGASTATKVSTAPTSNKTSAQ